jgi:hypothetical protein
VQDRYAFWTVGNLIEAIAVMISAFEYSPHPQSDRSKRRGSPSGARAARASLAHPGCRSHHGLLG